MVLMLLVHGTFVVDCVCIFYFGLELFYCFSVVVGLMHYVLMGPLLYYAFLWDFVFPPGKEPKQQSFYNSWSHRHTDEGDQYYSFGASSPSINDPAGTYLLSSDTPHQWYSGRYQQM